MCVGDGYEDNGVTSVRCLTYLDKIILTRTIITDLGALLRIFSAIKSRVVAVLALTFGVGVRRSCHRL